MDGKKITSVCVGIPTCWGGVSLLPTVKSIFASKGDYKLTCYIVADRTPIPKDIWNQIEALGAKIFWSDVEATQPAKIQRLLDMCDGDIFVTTQDDVIFEANTIPEIVKAFEHDPSIMTVSSAIAPLKARSFMEKVMRGVVSIPGRIAIAWNGGDNFLSASGRCISFRTSFMKTFRIPPQMVNGDMFLYLENKRLGGKFYHAYKSVAYIRAPESLKDQLGPSSRFQYSETELKPWFDFDISKEYRIPFHNLVTAFLAEWIRRPITTGLYAGVYFYTRMFPQPVKRASNPLWDMDASTKKL